MASENSIQHSPLPWDIDPGGRVIVSGEQRRLLATVGSGWLKYQDEDDANAAYIVQACNAYPALVAAALAGHAPAHQPEAELLHVLLEEQLSFDKYRIHTEDGPACQYCFTEWEYDGDTMETKPETVYHEPTCWVTRVYAALALRGAATGAGETT